jgi:hypothetical protein
MPSITIVVGVSPCVSIALCSSWNVWPRLRSSLEDGAEPYIWKIIDRFVPRSHLQNNFQALQCHCHYRSSSQPLPSESFKSFPLVDPQIILVLISMN